MNSAGNTTSSADAAESLLRADLAQGEAVLASIAPVLRHLVASEGHGLFSEEVVARTRGMVESLAQRLLRAGDESALRPDRDALIRALAAEPALLAHCHVLALEAQLGQRLAETGRIDPVLSPLLQARISCPQPDISAMAMTLLASQARFVQAQRRMEIAPGELPADLLHRVLATFGRICGNAAEPAATAIRGEFDEARGRLALLGRVVLGLGDDLALALDLDQAGTALFVTALALMTGHDRDSVVLATTEGQHVRLALLLAGAGLAPTAVETVLLRLNPDAAIPRHCLGVTRDRATALLAAGATQ